MICALIILLTCCTLGSLDRVEHAAEQLAGQHDVVRVHGDVLALLELCDSGNPLKFQNSMAAVNRYYYIEFVNCSICMTGVNLYSYISAVNRYMCITW